MREKFVRFMAGRYGNDQLNKAMTIASIVCLVLAMLFRAGKVSTLLWLLGITLLALIYVRMLSKNHYRRIDENNKYMRVKYNVTSYFKVLKERWVQRKEYKFFTCPSCHTTLRVPRGKGKINIVCRKCGNSFRGKT